MSLAARISRGVKASLGANLVDLLSNALLVVLLTRVFLTPAGYGRLNFALSVLGVVGILATLGLPKSTARYVTEYVERDPGQVPHVLRRGVAAVLLVTVVVCLALVALGGPLARLLGDPTLVPFLVLGSVLVAGQAIEKFAAAVLQGFNRVDVSAVLRVVSGLGRLVAVGGLLLLGLGAFGALAGYVLAAVAGALVGAALLYSRFYTQYDPSPSPDEGLTKRILEYSVPLTATRGANVLDKKVDAILVGVLVNVTAVGYYTVAKQVSDFVAMPAASFGFTISPAIGKEKSGDRLDRAARLYERSLQYVLLAYVPAVTGLVLVADPMVRYVFGTDYLGAVPVVQVFSGFIFVNAINKITSDGLDYLGRARSRAIVKTAMAVSNFLLNLVLIPPYGAVGAAAASVATYTVYTGTNVYVIHGELGFDVGRVARHFGVVCLVTAGMATVVTTALPMVSGLPTLLGVVALGGGVWAVLSVLGGVLDVHEVARFVG